MGLDISKITNAELKKLAYLKDDGDGNLNAEEFEIFKQEAAVKEGVSAEDFNQAMGLYKSAAATATEATPATEEPTSKEKKFVDKHADTRAENAVFRYMDEIIAKGTTRANLMAKLEEKIGNQNDDTRYVELKKAIKDILELMPAEYSTLDDVDRQNKEIVKKMEANGIKDKLHLEILEKLEDLAENEVRKAASEKIDGLYKNFAKVEENEPAKTQEQVMNAVKAELETKKQFKAEIKDAFESYEEKVIMKRAREYVTAAINQVENLTERKDVAKKAKEILVENGQWDKYTEKAMTQTKWADFITGKERTAKTQAKRRAVANNVELMKHQSKEDVLDKMGEKNEVYEALVSSGLITENGDNVDLSILSDIIGLQVGADNCLNRHAAIDKAISEKFRLNSALAVKSKLESMTENEAKKLAELTGYDIEGKDIRKIIISAIEGLIAGTSIGAAAAAANNRQSVLIEGDTINHNLNLELKGNIGADALGKLPDGVTVAETGAGVIINIAQMIKQPDRLVHMSKMIVGTAWKTGLMGAALGALKGLEDRGEEPVTVTNFTETDFEKYVERMQWELKQLGREELIEGFTCLAASCLNEDGSWDKASYLAKLNEIGGDGGKINIKEAPTSCPEETEEEDTTVEEHRYSQHDQAAVDPTYVDVPAIDGSKTGWPQIARQYECLVEKYQLSGAIRVLKLAQAIKDGNYSQERLDQLYALSKKGRAHLQNIEGFDYKAYCNALDATYLPKLEMKDGKPVPGTGVKVPEKLGDCTRNAELSLQVQGQVQQATVKVAPTGHAADRIQTSAGQGAKYYVRLDGGAIQAYDDKNVRDGIVEKFKKDYPNAIVEKWED